MVKLLILFLLSMLICSEVKSSTAQITQLKEDVNRLKAKLLQLRLKILSKKTTRSCDDHYHQGARNDGQYVIHLNNGNRMTVYCAFNYRRSGTNWMVIQRRSLGNVDFYRNWANYTYGFGDQKTGDFWIGLNNIHAATSNGPYEMRIDLEDFQGNKSFAHYKTFSVGDEASGFQLTVSGYNGTAGDCFSQHNGDQFSTYDQDRDVWYQSCAKSRNGGWWYKKCTFGNLNGKYVPGGGTDYQGIYWFYWKFSVESLKATTMMIRPSSRNITEAPVLNPATGLAMMTP